MPEPLLLCVEAPPERYAGLCAAIRAEGLRFGWLDLPAATPPPLPEPLETAAGLGALRAVSAGTGRTVALKPLKGAPVLADLLREHFRGCALVLVRGEAAGAAALREEGEGWVVTAPGDTARTFTSAELAAALRRPRPWGPPLPPRPVKPPKPEKKKRRELRVKRAKAKKGGEGKDRKDLKDR